MRVYPRKEKYISMAGPLMEWTQKTLCLTLPRNSKKKGLMESSLKYVEGERRPQASQETADP